MILIAALVAAALAAAHPQPAQSPPPPQQPEQAQPGGERPHQFGVGGSLVVSNQGASGGFRYWFGERLGVNVTAGWASAGRYSSGSSSAFVMPSFMYMITPPNKLREVDLRPYVGGGPTWVHTSAGAAARPGMMMTASANNWGMQAFGGVEMSFRSAKAMTISAEGIYYNVPSSVPNATNFSGFDWAVAFHFYVK